MNPAIKKTVQQFAEDAGNYCILLENATNFSKKDLLQKLNVLLPSLYNHLLHLKNTSLNSEDTYTEKFVSEDDWQKIHNTLILKTGQHNEYLEVFDPTMQEQDGPVTKSIAEDLSDIYQDLKDFITAYNLGNIESIKLAISECILNFSNYWGQKTVNLLRAIHNLCFGDYDLSDESNEIPQEGEELEDIDTNDWLITKKMRDTENDE
jgi:hypothetical protein